MHCARVCRGNALRVLHLGIEPSITGIGRIHTSPIGHHRAIAQYTTLICMDLSHTLSARDTFSRSVPRQWSSVWERECFVARRGKLTYRLLLRQEARQRQGPQPSVYIRTIVESKYLRRKGSDVCRFIERSVQSQKAPFFVPNILNRVRL